MRDEIDFAARRERLAYKSRLINNTTKLCPTSSSRPKPLRAPLQPSAAEKRRRRPNLNPTEVALFEVLEVNGAAGDPMLINSKPRLEERTDYVR